MVTTSNVDENMEKLNHLYLASGNVKWITYSGKRVQQFLKNLNMQLHAVLQLQKEGKSEPSLGTLVRHCLKIKIHGDAIKIKLIHATICKNLHGI